MSFLMQILEHDKNRKNFSAQHIKPIKLIYYQTFSMSVIYTFSNQKSYSSHINQS